VLSAGRRVAVLALVLGSALGTLTTAAGDPGTPPRAGAVDRASTANPLRVTIDGVRPSNLARGGKVRITGTVTNTQPTPWTDVQVFLNIDPTPIRDDGPFHAIVDAGPDTGFGTGPFAPGLYDQINLLRPQQTRRFALVIPQRDLSSPAGNGVFHLGVRVLGSNALGRDSITDGRADTFIPLMNAAGARRTARVLLLIPVTAPVHRWSDGTFMDDSLGQLIAPGGRLQNLLTLLDRAQPGIVEVALDPAVADAVAAMERGYRVTSSAQRTRPRRGGTKPPSVAGAHQQDAVRWFNTLLQVVNRQNLTLLPYADPDTTTLASAGLKGVLRATVRQGRQVGRDNQWAASVVGWTSDGVLTRHAATALAGVGARPLVLSDQALPGLSSPPPGLISYRSAIGTKTAVVTRSRLASVAVTRTLTPIRLGQALLAEATVAALGPPARRLVVAATAFDWNPGPDPRAHAAFRAFRASWVAPTTVADLSNGHPQPYHGKIGPATPRPSALGGLHLAELSAYTPDVSTFAALVDTPRVYSDMRRNLAIAGSDQWRHAVALGEDLSRVDAAGASRRLTQVTISGPSLVALSSDSGRFPLTVTNRLAVPITVSIEAQSTHALSIRPVTRLRLLAKQRRDIEMFGSARGSTVSSVRVRLATVNGRRFGQAWQFSVRTTQFGLVIWVLMGIGFAILVGTAALRVVRRVRRGQLTRAEGGPA
jgi:Family of unknown function (DUF6049)